MQYNRLGNAGVKVSRIALGSWLTYGSAVTDATAEACIDKAYELGINFFDTANSYRLGEAEQVVGKALGKYPRQSFVVATKGCWPIGDGPNDRGLSRKHIFEQVHASLKRLNVDYIDLWQCHRYDAETPLEESLRAIDDLVTQGKILYAGVSQWSAVQISDALHLARTYNLDRIVSNQPQYSMLERYIEKDIVPLCQREGIGLIVYSPLAQGVLTGKYKQGETPPADSRAADPEVGRSISRLLTEENLAKVEKLKRIAADKGCTLPQLALAWNLRLPVISSCIIGASRPQQIEENIKALDIQLSVEDMDEIENILA